MCQELKAFFRLKVLPFASVPCIRSCTHLCTCACIRVSLDPSSTKNYATDPDPSCTCVRSSTCGQSVGFVSCPCRCGLRATSVRVRASLCVCARACAYFVCVYERECACARKSVRVRVCMHIHVCVRTRASHPIAGYQQRILRSSSLLFR